ncbi:hypothetical protein C8R44DRAFT_747771 [Mycena epipterygia]|nr:hypothetical protein C8R44DRAFT_747771 [Mycena epipterygia]
MAEFTFQCSILSAVLPDHFPTSPPIFSFTMPPSLHLFSTAPFQPTSSSTSRGSYQHDIDGGQYPLSWSSLTEMAGWIQCKETEKIIGLRRKDHITNKNKKGHEWLERHVYDDTRDPTRIPSAPTLVKIEELLRMGVCPDLVLEQVWGNVHTKKNLQTLHAQLLRRVPVILLLPIRNSLLMPLCSEFKPNTNATASVHGKLKEAEELKVVVLERWRNLLGDNHPHTLLSMGNLASTYKALGRLKEAEELEIVVLKKRKNVLGDNHPETLIAMGNLAFTYTKLERWQEAQDLGEGVLKKRRNAMGNLAATYNKLERWQEELGIAALKRQMDLLGGKHPRTSKTMQNLAVTYEQLGKLTEGEGLNAILRGSQN